MQRVVFVKGLAAYPIHSVPFDAFRHGLMELI